MFTNQNIEIESLPSLETVALKPISKQYLKIIVFNKLLLYLALFTVLFVARWIVDKDVIQSNFWYLFAALLAICVLNFSIALLAFNKRKYAIREHDLIYAQGLLVHSITTVPISRIQHIEESRSWLARQLNLATLKIFTAGESGSDLSIKGLSNDEAKQINDFLSTKVNANN